MPHITSRYANARTLLFFTLGLISLFTKLVEGGTVLKEGDICTILASTPESNSTDDSGAILSAFEQCKENSRIVFPADQTYSIERVMETVGLSNVTIDIQGYLLWDKNITYWVDNSLPLGYLSFVCAWILGGKDIVIDGHHTGVFDGNGQVWYDFAKGVSNVPGRPMNLVITNTENVLVQNLKFIQSQFWTMVVNSTRDMVMRNVIINSTSFDGQPARNTDGIDTLYSDNITFVDMTIDNGDDCISTKANSSNIHIANSTFYRGLGVAIGNLGQEEGLTTFVENVTAENIECFGCRFAGYVKTWTGIAQGVPPNGGGGGLGWARNITFRNFTLHDLQSVGRPAQIGQCTSFSGATGGCDTSLYQLSNITWKEMTGNINGASIASLQCSGSAPCPGIEIDLPTGEGGLVVNSTTGQGTYKCSHVENPIGFAC